MTMPTGSAFSAFHRGTERLGCSRSSQQRILARAAGERFMIEHGCFVNCGQVTSSYINWNVDSSFVALGVVAMTVFSNQSANAAKLLAILFFAFVVVSLGVGYFVGDLATVQEAISAKESRAALRGVSDPEQLDQVLKQYPKNEILRMVLLENRDAVEIDAATRRLINEVEPRDFSTPIDFRAANRSDLDALRRDLKTAEINIAALRPRYIALIKAQHDKLENDARSLKVGNATLAKFMTMVDEQHKEIMTLASKMLAARAEYYGAYERCAALLVREFGTYKVTNGQFIFPFPSTANSYNGAAAALAAAANHIAELEHERTSLRQSQFNKWKDFPDPKV
ncbi:MAG: hypothetical protein KGK16_05300 [Bradyrhizobium sp.]|nr:hypothetical protein [Bradyrhizobium sp.]